MCLRNLHDLLIEELNVLHSASRETLAVLPQMAQAANALELRRAIENYAADKQTQMTDIEQAFQKLGAAPSDKKYPSVAGIIEEISDLLAASGDQSVLDTGLMSRLLRLQQYTMTLNEAVVCAYDKILAGENEPFVFTAHDKFNTLH